LELVHIPTDETPRFLTTLVVHAGLGRRRPEHAASVATHVAEHAGDAGVV
jgi:hypothetical protein